jgi:chaperone modulatory protein CbpM
MKRSEFLVVAAIETHVLESWVAAGWLLPQGQEDDYLSEIDLARAQLINDLKELGANEEAIPIILDLIDHLHGTRNTLQELLGRIHAQPEPVKKEILSGVPPKTNFK